MAPTPRSRSAIPRGLALAATLLLALPLAACAPEPDTSEAPTGSDTHGGNTLEEGESGHPEPPAEATKKNTELPASFPKEEFALPDGAVIDDTGERGPDQWFVVLRADSEKRADALSEQVSSLNHLQSEGVDEASGLTVLTKPGLRVELLSLAEGSSTLLSYELSRTVS
ncbi:hypothetical protein [Leucobacter ruminantium]|uniref:Lipoprotein n=1 Tax=Leucobacter ruminantium TaxID=1289170 RepID=A0A939LTZ7_9MICO|nr:hypothetical protein [Leucobacter ruminantium]MBO1804775.1 hypothetical protein [Leucobacter ruminantium]